MSSGFFGNILRSHRRPPNPPPGGPPRPPAGPPSGSSAGPPPGSPRGITHRFGSKCPVCNHPLGEPTPRTSADQFVAVPSLRLEVGRRADDGTYPWRFHPIGQPRFGLASSRPPFHTTEVEFVYLLCTNGHIFPDAAPSRRPYDGDPTADEYRIDRYRMVAAIGPTASGKTYLVLRTIMQSLVNENRLAGAGGWHTRECALSPLEKIPLTDRLASYDEMLTTGLPIPQTTLFNNEGTPSAIFAGRFLNLIQAVQDFIRHEVVDGGLRAERWGRELRQPLILRTAYADRRTWTGFADLPGEQFGQEHADERMNAQLRLYDALIWVLDPVVASNLETWFNEESIDPGRSFDDVLEGSLRPGSMAKVRAADVRIVRDRIQQTIGHTLGVVDSTMQSSTGDTRSTLIAITKCDVIHAALGTTLPDLQRIGPPGRVVLGAANYLLACATLHRKQQINPDRATAALLDHVNAADDANTAVRQRIATSVATGILDYYSEPGRFWDLVNGAAYADEFDTGKPNDDAQYRIAVPTVGDHMNEWNDPRNPARYLQIRDLVMSVVGSGIAYGLGYGKSVLQLLYLDSHDTRFFLCTPLGSVPTAVPADEDETPTMMSTTAPAFPNVSAESAGMTQLLLAVLGRAAG